MTDASFFLGGGAVPTVFFFCNLQIKQTTLTILFLKTIITIKKAINLSSSREPCFVTFLVCDAA